jgi:predicted dehydrogenase
MISNFMDSILNGTPMSPNGEEGLNRVRLLEAIYDSAEQGRELAFAPSTLTSRETS